MTRPIYFAFFVALVNLFVLSACTESAHESLAAVHNTDEASTHGVAEFGGKIARSYAESEEWWPPEKTPAGRRAQCHYLFTG